MEPEAISSRRLDLPSLSAEQMEALVTGDVATVTRATGVSYSREWLEDNLRLLAYRARQVRADPTAQKWLLRPIVLRRADHVAIGTINFHGPSDEHGMVEVGYVLLPEFRGRGYAIEAVRALFAWASLDPQVRVFRASVALGNERSLSLIAKLGFVVGEQMDEEDGLELVFEVLASNPA